MKEFLETNGPWDQLVELGNVELTSLKDFIAENASHRLIVSRIIVPHRDEYSETVGFVIGGPSKSLLFLPDIDSWRGLEASGPFDNLERSEGNKLWGSLLSRDYVFLDATFYDDNELPGRDMSKIPHPRVTETMDMFDSFGIETRDKSPLHPHQSHKPDPRPGQWRRVIMCKSVATTLPGAARVSVSQIEPHKTFTRTFSL